MLIFHSRKTRTQIANPGHGKDSRKRESEDHLMLPALVKVLGR
jgi:hypothetical protein